MRYIALVALIVLAFVSAGDFHHWMMTHPIELEQCPTYPPGGRPYKIEMCAINNVSFYALQFLRSHPVIASVLMVAYLYLFMAFLLSFWIYGPVDIIRYGLVGCIDGDRGERLMRDLE